MPGLALCLATRLLQALQGRALGHLYIDGLVLARRPAGSSGAGPDMPGRHGAAAVAMAALGHRVDVRALGRAGARGGAVAAVCLLILVGISLGLIGLLSLA